MRFAKTNEDGRVQSKGRLGNAQSLFSASQAQRGIAFLVLVSFPCDYFLLDSALFAMFSATLLFTISRTKSSGNGSLGVN